MFFNSKKYSLIADIGGTKTVLAIMDSKDNILLKKVYLSRDIKHFTDTLHEFMHMKECKKYNVKDACIAVSGPVNTERDYARPTNLSWTVDKHSILVRTPLRRVVLLNDFEAVGFAMDTLKQEQYIELTDTSTYNSETIAVIGVGTGLGISILPNTYGKHFPLPSEGGHIDLPINSKDAIDTKFQSYLIQKKLYHDAEDVVSGRGIVNIYNFLLTQKVKHDKRIAQTIRNEVDADKPAIITKYALEDRDALCIRTLELFIKYYARISRNLALTTLCSRLVLAGGISPKIVSALQDVFVEEFVQHDVESMRKMLEQIQIIVITDQNITLQGAMNALKI